MNDKWVIIIIVTAILVVVAGIFLAVFLKKTKARDGDDEEEDDEPYVRPHKGEVTPREWATSSFAPSIFFGMSPTIYFRCGECHGETMLKVPMETVPYEGGLRLRCQCCGKPNRLPIVRM